MCFAGNFKWAFLFLTKLQRTLCCASCADVSSPQYSFFSLQTLLVGQGPNRYETCMGLSDRQFNSIASRGENIDPTRRFLP
jgi:hypothetical protein